MFAQRCVVDNRVFLLGLDRLYREYMKLHESTELLKCARRVAAALHVTPANVPVEGYYSEKQELTEYFRLMRALQEINENRTPEVADLPEFHRLRDVTSAPLYGRPQYLDKLLAVGWDSLSQALSDTLPKWTVARLTAAAYAVAKATDDISLVGLAARIQDPPVLAALRESVVLYAATVAFGRQPKRKYVWKVDDDLADLAKRFIDTFNGLFGEELPPPVPEQAGRYWHASVDNKILGRCVRLGFDNSVSPTQYYHWGVCYSDRGKLVVQDFWHTDVWTTERYRSALHRDGRCPDL